MPCSCGLTFMVLRAALKSRARAIQLPYASRCWKLFMTSCAEGSATCSGILQSVLALQTVLSSTRRGSRPSASTMLSLPTAMPCGQCLAAAVRSPAKAATCPAWISLATRERSRAGSLSALVQLPVHCCSCMSSWSLSVSWRCCQDG